MTPRPKPKPECGHHGCERPEHVEGDVFCKLHRDGVIYAALVKRGSFSWPAAGDVLWRSDAEK